MRSTAPQCGHTAPLGQRRSPFAISTRNPTTSRQQRHFHADDHDSCVGRTLHSNTRQSSAAKWLRAHAVHMKRCKRLISIVNRAGPSWAQRRVRDLAFQHSYYSHYVDAVVHLGP
jgi:hypothetical protein